MLIKNRNPTQKPAQDSALLDVITADYLQHVINKIAIPRHYFAEKYNNQAVGDWIEQEFVQHGLYTSRQGSYGNIVASFTPSLTAVRVLIGAHFDSVPHSPGADDNASAVAGMLAAAQALAQLDAPAVAFVAFNREEDGLLGSQEFVTEYLNTHLHALEVAHILEMIGYYSDAPHSQTAPEGLPIKISDKGDFIAVIANRYSNHLITSMMRAADTYVPDLSVKALKVFLGVEKFFPHLLRSDHAPFWHSKLPALMWTDTSEFRNPHYHQPTDTPDTLNYAFLQKVTALLTMQVAMHLEIAA